MYDFCAYMHRNSALYNARVVSDGLFLNMHLLYLLYPMSCCKYVFNIIVASRGMCCIIPGGLQADLTGVVWGRSPPS